MKGKGVKENICMLNIAQLANCSFFCLQPEKFVICQIRMKPQIYISYQLKYFHQLQQILREFHSELHVLVELS